MRARWNAFWFAPASPLGLALCRIVFYGGLALGFAGTPFADWADVAPVFWRPTWSFAALGLGVLPPAPLAIVAWTWKLALVAACVGLATRLSTITSLLLGYYLLGLPNGFGKIHHHDAIVVFVCAILALARSGDALSLDRALRARGAAASAPSGEYTWPLRMVWVLMALLFFGAGASKLRASGLDWVLSDHLAIVLVQGHYHVNDVVPATTFGLGLARHRWVCRALAATVLGAELAYPLALVSRSARRVIVPGVLLMQIGIRILLGPSFGTWMLCNVFWVPWDALLARRRGDAERGRADQPRVAALRAAS